MLSLFSALILTGSLGSSITFAKPIISSRSSSKILNSTYLQPKFQQSRSNIDSYSLSTINELLTRSDFPTGWVGQNGWTVISQWDHQQGTRAFYDQFAANESYYATNPTGCYEYWGSPLVDCYNDDAGWAALASLQGYQAYGDEVFLKRAESVFEVSLVLQDAHLGISHPHRLS